MNARSKRARRGEGGRLRLHPGATLPAVAGKAPMADDIGRNRRYLDLIVFANQFHVGVGCKAPAAALAQLRLVVTKLIGIVRQPPAMRLMPGFGPAGTGALTLFLPVRRRRL